MSNKITFKIFSIDGKLYTDEVDALYFNVPSSGVIGLLPDHLPYTAMLDIGTFYIVKNNEKTYFAISDGLLNFKDNEAIILTGTYEKEDELDKERIEKDRERALNLLSSLDKKDTEAYENASFSLKKAINRLKLLK